MVGIDATAAPGNKSLQLSELVGKLSSIIFKIAKVFSYEKDEKRYQTLSKRTNQSGATNIMCLNQDFLESNPAMKSLK